MSEARREDLLDGAARGARYALHPPDRAGGPIGALLGKGVGASLEFMDHRDYQPGDDLRRINWQAYARSDQLIVKLYRNEVAPHVDLLVDASSSMAVDDLAKARAATILAGLLVEAARNAGYTHTAWRAGELIAPIEHSHAAPTGWAPWTYDSVTSPPDGLSRGAPGWRREGVRILLSDLLFEGDPAVVLGPLCHNAAQVVVIQILGRCDLVPEWRGNSRLVDSETGRWRELFLDAAGLAAYRRRLTEHRRLWHAAARRFGARFAPLHAEEFIDEDAMDTLVTNGILEVA